MKNILFVCGRNKRRSPTAEEIFSAHPGIETASAGTSPDAETPLTPDLIAWADVIFVMESAHKRKLSTQFGALLKNKRVVCLNIPDKFAYRDDGLVRLLTAKVTPLLR
jgi:predicted protein tyrosine phosphatase